MNIVYMIRISKNRGLAIFFLISILFITLGLSAIFIKEPKHEGMESQNYHLTDEQQKYIYCHFLKNYKDYIDINAQIYLNKMRELPIPEIIQYESSIPSSKTGNDRMMTWCNLLGTKDTSKIQMYEKVTDIIEKYKTDLTEATETLVQDIHDYVIKLPQMDNDFIILLDVEKTDITKNLFKENDTTYMHIYNYINTLFQKTNPSVELSTITCV